MLSKGLQSGTEFPGSAHLRASGARTVKMAEKLYRLLHFSQYVYRKISWCRPRNGCISCLSL